MTHVYLEQDGDRYTVRCEGHAVGSVELCAAISCLLYTAAGWLHNAEAEILEERLDPGDAKLVFRGGDDCGTLFEILIVGFLQLQKADGARLCVDFEKNF